MVFPLPVNMFCPDINVCVHPDALYAVREGNVSSAENGGGTPQGGWGIWGVVFYIKAIVLLPQLHVTSIYSATRLCYLSGPPSTPSSPALTSQK